MLTNPHFWSRMQTIETYEEEGAAIGRLVTWYGAVEMIKDQPFGAGGKGWYLSSPQYVPELVEAYEGKPRSVHNIFLQLTTSWGIQGFMLYAVFILVTFVQLHKIRKRKGTQNDVFY